VGASEFDMMVRLYTSTYYGTDEEIEERNALGDELAEELGSRGLGEYDGTDCGGGNCNIHVYRVPADRWDEALALAVAAIERRGLGHKARVIQFEDRPEAEPGDSLVRVAWPPGVTDWWSPPDGFTVDGE
jgi:hypothetical protein